MVQQGDGGLGWFGWDATVEFPIGFGALKLYPG
jgi:hypothetical protein